MNDFSQRLRTSSYYDQAKANAQALMSNQDDATPEVAAAIKAVKGRSALAASAALPMGEQ